MGEFHCSIRLDSFQCYPPMKYTPANWVFLHATFKGNEGEKNQLHLGINNCRKKPHLNIQFSVTSTYSSRNHSVFALIRMIGLSFGYLFPVSPFVLQNR